MPQDRGGYLHFVGLVAVFLAKVGIREMLNQVLLGLANL